MCKLWGSVTNAIAGTLTQSASTEYVSGKYGHFSGVTTSSTGVVEMQLRIPADEAARFVDQPATFSCLVLHDLGVDATYTVTVKKPNSADDFTVLSTVSTSGGEVVPSGVNERLEFTVDDLGDVSNGIIIEVSIPVATIVTKSFRISEAQFETGDARTTFSEQQYEVAEVACRRVSEAPIAGTVYPHAVYRPNATAVSAVGSISFWRIEGNDPDWFLALRDGVVTAVVLGETTITPNAV